MDNRDRDRRKQQARNLALQGDVELKRQTSRLANTINQRKCRERQRAEKTALQQQVAALELQLDELRKQQKQKQQLQQHQQEQLFPPPPLAPAPPQPQHQQNQQQQQQQHQEHQKHRHHHHHHHQVLPWSVQVTPQQPAQPEACQLSAEQVADGDELPVLNLRHAVQPPDFASRRASASASGPQSDGPDNSGSLGNTGATSAALAYTSGTAASYGSKASAATAAGAALAAAAGGAGGFKSHVSTPSPTPALGDADSMLAAELQLLMSCRPHGVPEPALLKALTPAKLVRLLQQCTPAIGRTVQALAGALAAQAASSTAIHPGVLPLDLLSAAANLEVTTAAAAAAAAAVTSAVAGGGGGDGASDSGLDSNAAGHNSHHHHPQQQQQQLPALLRPPPAGVAPGPLEELLKQQLRMWCWLSSYCHLAAPQAMQEVLPASGGLGHLGEMFWDMQLGEVLLMPGQTAALTNAAQSYLHTLQQLKAEQRMACHSLLGTTSEALSSTRQVLQQQQEAQALVAGLRQKLVQQQLALVQLQHSLYTEVLSTRELATLLMRCHPQLPDAVAITRVLMKRLKGQLANAAALQPPSLLPTDAALQPPGILATEAALQPPSQLPGEVAPPSPPPGVMPQGLALQQPSQVVREAARRPPSLLPIGAGLQSPDLLQTDGALPSPGLLLMDVAGAGLGGDGVVGDGLDDMGMFVEGVLEGHLGLVPDNSAMQL